MEIKTALVTGATGAIGYGIAKLIAENPDYKLVILARNKTKAKNLVNEIINQTANEKVSYVICDLSRKHEIRALAESWQGPLNVLINNAGATPRRREETPEGIEMQFATNVLGYFWMMKYFSEILNESAPSRIVNVASYWAGDLDLKDLEFKQRHYNNDTAYRQTKAADRMITAAFSNRLAKQGISINACHPGDVNSALSNNLGYGGHESPEQGADTPVWLGISEDVEGITGKYFEHRQESVCRFAKKSEDVETLFEICDSY